MLDAAERVLGGEVGALDVILEHLAEARAVTGRSRALFERLWSTMLVPPEYEPQQVAERIRRHFDEQEQAFTRIDEFMAGDEPWKLQQAVFMLEGSTARLLEELDELRSFNRAQPRRSPFGVFNYVIRTALRLRAGTAAPGALRAWLPAATLLVEQLQGHIEIFSRLHPEASSLCSAAEACVAEMRQGIGALLSFLDGRDGLDGADGALAAALDDGVKLLEQPSQRLAPLLKQMDAQAGQRHAESRVATFDEFERATEKFREGHLDDALLWLSFNSLRQLEQFYAGQVRAIERFPLFYLLRSELDAARATVAQLGVARERAERELRGGGGDWAWLPPLRSAFESCYQAIMTLTARLQEEALCMRASPHVEELRELAGRMLLGTVSQGYFVERTDVLAQALAEVQYELHSNDVAEAMAALEQMQSYVGNNNPAALTTGVQRLSAVVPTLLHFKRLLSA